MESEKNEYFNFIATTINKIKKKKKLLIFFFLFTSLTFVGIIYLNYQKNNQNKIISEKYITAGILLASNNGEKSKEIYKEIIDSKHSFYSLLALNSILENNLIQNNDDLIDLFEIVEKIKLEKNKIDLVKLKKSLYFLKISKKEEGKKLLNEIISDNSKWKNIAVELSK